VGQIDVSGIRNQQGGFTQGVTLIGLAEGRIFDKGLLDKSEQELKRQYISRENIRSDHDNRHAA
jgi:outer membrane protein insertion porin family